MLKSLKSVCKSLMVFVSSNRFREDLKQYGNAATASFITSTSDTIEITKAAIQCLESIYQSGIMYKKTGVVVSEITPESPLQLDLFDPNQKRKERKELMKAMDEINHRFGSKTLRLAVEGTGQQSWHVKCEHRSPNYLTDIDGILTVKV